MSFWKLHAALDVSVAPATTPGPTAPVRHPQDEVLFQFDACGPSLLRYVKSLGLDAETSKDIVQEVFLALFYHVRMDRPRDNLKGWLFKVAHNLALRHRHTAKRQQTDFVSDATLAELVIDPASNPEQRLADAQRRRRLLAVMNALPERDRQCLGLRAEGLRYREIAEVLDISLGSVAKSLTRSLARLSNV